jgi:hypothetical protein
VTKKIILSGYDFESRDSYITFEKTLAYGFRVFRNIIALIVLTFFFGVLWYRFSDYFGPGFFSN